MRRGQPTTYAGAVSRAALVVGAPVSLWTVLDALGGELSWGTALLRLLIWAAVSAQMALAFSGGVEPRRGRDGQNGH